MRPARIVVDASVLIAIVTPRETEHRTARQWLQHCTESSMQLVVPAIVLAEFCGALSRTGRSASSVERLLTAFRSRPDFVVEPLPLSLAEEAGKLALLQRLRGCDAVYMALARALHAPLVTLDHEQKDRASADVEVLAPQEALAAW